MANSPAPVSCSSTDLYGRIFDTSVTGMAFADHRCSPVLTGVERPEADHEEEPKEEGQEVEPKAAKRKERPHEEVGCTLQQATPEHKAKCDPVAAVTRVPKDAEQDKNSSDEEWSSLRPVGKPSGCRHMQGCTGAPEHKVARYVLHEKAERYHFGNDSEEESTAEQERATKRQGKRQGKTVRTKSKSERLLTGRRK